MPSFANLNLFDAGPCRFHVGGLTLRTADQPGPDTNGTRLVAQGRSSRTITQTGTLVADDVDGLLTLSDAIEDRLDGLPNELIDDTGRVWDGVVMLRFEPGPIVAVGPRCRVDYTIDYVQAKP
ncbi:MAG: hypothetical protein AAF800_09475 [Planctomycetota bacterium]